MKMAMKPELPSEAAALKRIRFERRPATAN